MTITTGSHQLNHINSRIYDGHGLEQREFVMRYVNNINNIYDIFILGDEARRVSRVSEDKHAKVRHLLSQKF